MDVIVVLFFGHLQVTIETVYLTAGSLAIIALKLNGCMIDMIFLVEHGSKRLQNG
jgi:hypothetical protein